MVEPGMSRNEAQRWMSVPPASACPADLVRVEPEPTLAHTRLELRRMRFLRDLLVAGYRHALTPDPQSRTLRTERIALGIDLPELDTVPLWSVRRSDGTVSIPFIEFLLAQICAALDRFCADPLLTSHSDAEDLAAARRALAAILEQASPESEPELALPRLGDIYISEELLERLCAADGLLDLIVSRCEALIAAGP